MERKVSIWKENLKTEMHRLWEGLLELTNLREHRKSIHRDGKFRNGNADCEKDYWN